MSNVSHLQTVDQRTERRIEVYQCPSIKEKMTYYADLSTAYFGNPNASLDCLSLDDRVIGR